MGLFNFFKSKNDQFEYSREYNLRKLKCDVEKFHAIVELVKIPKNERDTSWQKSLLENIDAASFSESNPQIKIGHDGFPYFVFKTNENFNPFESFCIRKLKDSILLERGFGVVLNPVSNHESDWIFSCGDILNFHLNNEFYSNKLHSLHTGEEIISEDKEVMISQPSENYLPDVTKKFLKTTLIREGISKPKMTMISRMANNEMIHELIFNIFREDFPQENAFKMTIQKLQWYLPKHYIISAISKKSDLNKHLKAF